MFPKGCPYRVMEVEDTDGNFHLKLTFNDQLLPHQSEMRYVQGLNNEPDRVEVVFTLLPSAGAVVEIEELLPGELKPELERLN